MLYIFQYRFVFKVWDYYKIMGKSKLNKMMEKSRKRGELRERTADAILLGFSTVIRNIDGKPFVIPSSHRVAGVVNYALRKICGEQEGFYGWWSELAWNTIANKEKIPERLRESIPELLNHREDEYSSLDYYLDISRPWNYGGRTFDEEWVYLKGSLHRFSDGKRFEAMAKVLEYFSWEELDFFQEMHPYLNECIEIEFQGRLAVKA